MPNVIAIKEEFNLERRQYLRQPEGEPYRLNIEDLENHLSSISRKDSELNRYIRCILQYEELLGSLIERNLE